MLFRTEDKEGSSWNVVSKLPPVSSDLLTLRNTSPLAGRYKDFYLQSHLIGTPTLFVGYRDQRDILQQTEFIPTADLASRLSSEGRTWDPQENINWGYKVLTTLRAHCQQKVEQANHLNGSCVDPCDRIWRVEIKGRQGISVRELGKNEIDNVNRDGERRIGIIPAQFINEMRKVQ